MDPDNRPIIRGLPRVGEQLEAMMIVCDLVQFPGRSIKWVEPNVAVLQHLDEPGRTLTVRVGATMMKLKRGWNAIRS